MQEALGFGGACVTRYGTPNPHEQCTREREVLLEVVRNLQMTVDGQEKDMGVWRTERDHAVTKANELHLTISTRQRDIEALQEVIVAEQETVRRLRGERNSWKKEANEASRVVVGLLKKHGA